MHPIRRTIEYKAPTRVCAVCVLRAQCTRSHHGRTVQRHEKQALLDVARVQANSRAAWRNRRRRQHLIERSFADAANNHHFKRARWRRLWRQQIQDYLIAAIQNIRILLSRAGKDASAEAGALKTLTVEAVLMVFSLLQTFTRNLSRHLARTAAITLH